MVSPIRSSATAVVVLLAAALALTSCVSRNVETLSDEEKAALASPPPPPAVEASQDAAAAPGAAAAGVLTGVVDIAPELSDRVPDQAVLYLIVRVAGRDGGAPLRVKRLTPSTFPIRFEITDADAMMPNTPLVPEMTLVAKIDQDGNAFSDSAGDLIGRIGPIGPDDGELTVIVDELLTGSEGA